MANTESLDLAGNARVFGTTIDVGAFEFNNNIVWTGTTSNDWDTANNWNLGTIPTTTSDVIIPNDVTNYPTASNAVTVNTITIHSGASFLANDVVTGTVTYHRNLPNTDWYLVASPVVGETINNLVSNHTFATGTGSNKGFALHDNDDATAPWNYTTSTGNIIDAKGYGVKLDAPGDISFSGTINNDAFTYYTLTNGNRTDYNLVGNPYTGYMNLYNFLENEGNTFLLENRTIWLWDGTEYITHNLMTSLNTSPFYVAPGQAFFVQAIPDLTSLAYQTLAFEKNDQLHNATDTFKKEEATPNFELFITNNSVKKSTKVFYLAGKTTGLDKGYDSEMFRDTSYNLAVFTELVSDNQGDKLAIQTLPDTNEIIPVGVIADAGKEITFSVEALNLPEGVQLYLEDKEANAYINLSETNYTTTLTNKSEGTGQFYIHQQSR